MPEISPSGFEVLQAAVRAARDKQIKTVQLLRAHLAGLFPARSEDIEQAVAYWSAHVRRIGINA